MIAVWQVTLDSIFFSVVLWKQSLIFREKLDLNTIYWYDKIKENAI